MRVTNNETDRIMQSIATQAVNYHPQPTVGATDPAAISDQIAINIMNIITAALLAYYTHVGEPFDMSTLPDELPMPLPETVMFHRERTPDTTVASLPHPFDEVAEVAEPTDPAAPTTKPKKSRR